MARKRNPFVTPKVDRNEKGYLMRRILQHQRDWEMK
jgi:hypothetical protein